MAHKKAPPQKDPLGNFSRVYEVIIDSPAWRALSFSAKALYMEMRRNCRPNTNGNISATVVTMKDRGFGASATLAKALRELETAGLIAKTRRGHIATGAKVCNLWRFTDQPHYKFPSLGIDFGQATNDWRKWTSVEEARAAIKAAHAAARSRSRQKEVQFPKCNSSEPARRPIHNLNMAVRSASKNESEVFGHQSPKLLN